MNFEVRSLPGLTRFAEVHELQKKLLAQRIAGEIPDTFIFCEHQPVITRGRGLQFRSDRVERSKKLEQIPEGTDYVEIERGGDLTWHGPGQLVMYPIVKISDQSLDRWIRHLETIWIQTFQSLGVETFAKAGGSGVWIRDQGLDRKLVSVGIAVKKWVSYHGTATNVCNSQLGFSGFDPCGYGSEVMARAQDLPAIPKEYLGTDWRPAWERLLTKMIVATK